VMFRQLILFLIFLECFASISFGAEIRADRVHEVYRNCLQRSFQNAECQFTPIPPGPYRYGFTGFGGVIAGVGDVGHAIKNVGQLVCGEACHYGINEGESNYNYLVREILARKKKESLSDCQSACLVKCVSGTLLKYDRSGNEKFSSAQSLTQTQNGQCTE